MSALGHHIPSFVHHSAAAGYDCIWLDLEHRLIGEQEVQNILLHCHIADIDCMVRPPTLEKTRLYRYLEDGATGLMIPHVSTPEKARKLADAVKFPPLGDRGLDGAGFDANFFLNNIDQYTQEANRETFLVVQLETQEAIENADEIASVEGVDAMFIGPGDLGMRHRMGASSISPDAALGIVAAAAKKHNTAWGCPAFNVEQMAELHAIGARLVAHGGDFMALKNMLEQEVKHYDDMLQINSSR